MSVLAKQEMDTIREAVEAQFPDDPALQQVHIARKIIAREAELKGLSYLDCAKLIASESRSGKRG